MPTSLARPPRHPARRRTFRLLLPVLACAFLSISTPGAPSSTAPAAPPSAATAASPDSTAPEAAPISRRERNLLVLLRSLEEFETRLDTLQRLLASPRSEGRREVLLSQEREMALELDELRGRFKEAASGVDLGTYDGQEDQTLDLAAEVKELLGPVIDELKRATTRPRELDRAGREIGRVEERLAVAARARAHLAELQAEIGDPALAEGLRSLDREWEDEQHGLESAAAYARERLERLEQERMGFSESVEGLFGLFFRSRGRNLLLALATLFVFALTCRWLAIPVQRLSPLHRRPRGGATRIFDLLYLLFTWIGATAAYLSVLYLTGDWVLLTLSAILLVGLAWASRTALPRFWTQIMLLLNLGSVREGERLLLHGLPWRVQALGLYTYLENPELEGGRLRIPIRMLTDLCSRPAADTEPWFPTQHGDWVMLPDGSHARVEVQTPELVRLVQLGGAHRTMPAAELLASGCANLSAGYRLEVSFGVDYAHQALATTVIPELLRSELRHGLESAGHGADLLELSVEFESAGSSSLDLRLIADLAGSAAASQPLLARRLQSLCVDACNRHGWVIPFTQVTLHQS